jgi:hypothetical protein
MAQVNHFCGVDLKICKLNYFMKLHSIAPGTGDKTLKPEYAVITAGETLIHIDESRKSPQLATTQLFFDRLLR